MLPRPRGAVTPTLVRVRKGVGVGCVVRVTVGAASGMGWMQKLEVGGDHGLWVGSHDVCTVSRPCFPAASFAAA